MPFTDAPNGFYGMLQKTFEGLAREEDAACDWEGLEPVDWPNFGSKDDDYEDVVRPFYRRWGDFQTKKTFSWRDQYRMSDAPDRQMRRLMEKENQKLRDQGIREFNEAVRVLVSFVRKRDPRYIPNTQTEDDRQKILREAAAAQAARSRKENKKKFEEHVVPDWAKAQAAPEEATGTFSDEEEEVVEVTECVVCGKTFKSEKQYETHEKSKKHIQSVKQLQREMKWENEAMGLGNGDVVEDDVPAEKFAKLKLDVSDGEDEKSSTSPTYEIEVQSEEEFGVKSGYDSEAADESISIPPSNLPKEDDFSPDTDDDDDEYASRKEVLERLSNDTTETTQDSTPAASDLDTSTKVGKAKLKKAKKAAKQAAETTSFKCASCQESFKSRNELYTHIDKEGHAIPVSDGKKPAASSRKMKGKKQRGQK